MTRAAAHHRASARHGERGLSDSLQWTILAPLIMLLVVGAIEAATVLQARACVAQAALAGAEAGAVAGGGSPDAARAAVLAVTRGGGLTAVDISTDQSATGSRITVQAHVDLPLDLGFGAVRSTATIPKER